MEDSPDVMSVHAAMSAAMLDADTDALDRLLAPDFRLTHLTGYVQPRAEWLRQVVSGEMAYHRIDTVAVQALNTYTVQARTYTEATIWGAHGTWPLALRSRCERKEGRWVVTATVATVWEDDLAGHDEAR